jgi:tetratricopeptide (TPR) repeat protein
VNAAGILHAKGAHGAAMAQLDSLLEFSATHAKGLLLYAQCLEATQRHEEAIAACKKAAAAHPKNGEAQLALGKLLQARGETEAAAAYLLAARDLASNPAEALAVQAGFEMESGQFATAAETIRAALRKNPKQANAWLTLSELKKFKRNDEDIPAMQALLGAQGLQGYQEQIHLNFALGKAYLDFGETARGFSYLDTGNRMKRAGIDFDLEQTKKWMRAIAAQFSAARMASLAHSGLPDESALFIIGMPRSGTSLVEQILASHEQIFGAGELTSVQRQVDQLARITRLPYPEFAASLNPERLHRFAAAHLENLRRRSTHRYVVDKMPSNFFYAGLIHLALPNAQIIHVRRNAADTCFSCYTKLFGGPQQFAYDQAELGGFYRAYENLMAHWREVLPQSRFIEVIYEDLVADIEGESRRLLNFCGLQWHEACARFFETERSVRTASATQVRQPPYRSSIGRAEQYRKHLTPLFAALEG